MLLGIVLVYLIMVALYESVVYPFVVLFSIPVALVGALLALALSMESLTIFAIVGLIMLLGLVAKNGILIVDFTNQLRAEGKGLTESLVEAEGTFASYPNDHHCHDSRNATHCTGIRRRRRSKARHGLGNHWRSDKFTATNPGTGSIHVYDH
jgi:hypothetical protein